MYDLTFPTENAPKFLMGFGSDISDVYGVPIEFSIISLISGFATAIGNKAMLSTEKYFNYPQFWFIIVAPSGTGKSEPLAVAYKPIHDYENKVFLEYKESFRNWEAQCFQAKVNNLSRPEKPILKRVTCSDTTPEALFEMLEENPSLTVYRDELDGHFKDVGRYNSGGEVGHWLSCFNNKQFSIDRKGSKMPVLVSKPILSMVGTIQPEVIRKVATKHDMQENGYLQRCLFVFPDNVSRPPYSEKTLNPELVTRYENMINFYLVSSATCEFKLSAEAMEKYISFHNMMAVTADDMPEEYMQSLFSKMSIHVLRLALVLAVIENDVPNTVSGTVMKYAIDLCHYFIETGRKMHVPPPEPNLTSGDCYRTLHQTIGIKKIPQFAESLGVSEQAIRKALSVLKT
jgi:hypothetical protein